MATHLTEEQLARTVTLEECICPDGGHEAGDSITFRERLDYPAVRAIRYAGAMAREDDPESSMASLMAVMNEGFILHGIESWTLRDAKRRAIEVEPRAIRAHVLANIAVALEVGDFADMLYQPQVLRPLQVLARRSSPPSPTNGSTSAPNGSRSNGQASTETSNGRSSTRSAKPRTRSRRSSTTSTPTGGTGATSSASAGAST